MRCWKFRLRIVAQLPLEKSAENLLDKKCCALFSIVISGSDEIYPSTGLDRPIGFQEVEAYKTSRKSALEGAKVVSPTHRPPLSLQVRFLVLISVRVWVDSRVLLRPEGLMKNSNNPIRSRTRDLPACSAVPQATFFYSFVLCLYFKSTWLFVLIVLHFDFCL